VRAGLHFDWFIFFKSDNPFDREHDALSRIMAAEFNLPRKIGDVMSNDNSQRET
jgi:hypothetical protein